MKRFFENVEEILLILFLITITIFLGLQIIFRYVFMSSISFSEELVRILFVWSSFVCVPYTIKKGRMLKIDNIYKKLPEKAKNIVGKIIDFVMIFTFTFLLFFSLILVLRAYGSGQFTPALRMPIWILYLSSALASLLSIIRLIQRDRRNWWI